MNVGFRVVDEWVTGAYLGNVTDMKKSDNYSIAADYIGVRQGHEPAISIE